MTATVIRSEEWDRNTRIRQLGLVLAGHDDPRWGLLEVVRAAVAGRAGSTGNDARAVAGFNAWSFPTRRLRELYRGHQGWDAFETNGVEGIINEEKKLKVIAVSTDEGTCDPDVSPRNRTRKGPATGSVIDLNSQLSLFGPQELAAQKNGFQTWEVCTFDDGNDVRAELSCPTVFDGGHFIKFDERIFLVDLGEWNRIAIDMDSGGADDIVPEVRRRK